MSVPVSVANDGGPYDRASSASPSVILQRSPDNV